MAAVLDSPVRTADTGLAALDLEVERPPVAVLLEGLGVDLSGSNAAALMLGATDVLLAVEMAQSLPAMANFQAALNTLHTLKSPVLAKVREAQVVVLDAVESEFEVEIAIAGGLLAGRLAHLRSRLTWLNQGSVAAAGK